VIAKSTIDQVYETARVEEVIGDFVQLKKSGTNFKGLSPFSQERTPSFMVSPVKQIWKDFSSGKGGNVVAFLMEHERFTYPEAIRYLTNKYAIERLRKPNSLTNKKPCAMRVKACTWWQSMRVLIFKKIYSKPKRVKPLGGPTSKSGGLRPRPLRPLIWAMPWPKKMRFPAPPSSKDMR